MQVRLELIRSIGLHDQVDVVDVDAARGDICGDEHLRLALREALDVARALGLVQVAVQRDRAQPRVVELLGEHLGVGAGAGEHERLAVAIDELLEDLGLAAVLDHDHAVVDRAGLLRLAGDLVDGGLGEELVDERGDLAVEGRGEQQLLAAVGGQAQDALHRLEEAELAHVVGLVDHAGGDARQVEFALLVQILDPAGRSDHDVDALLQRADLTPLRNAAVDLRREQAHGAGDRLHSAVDLQRQLAGRSQDEGDGCAAELALGALLRAQDALDQRCAERDRLAGAGAASGEHIATVEDRRGRRRLDRERSSRSHLGEHPHDVVAQAEVGEGRLGDLAGVDRLRGELLMHDVDAVLLRTGARRLLLLAVLAPCPLARVLGAAGCVIAAVGAGTG